MSSASKKGTKHFEKQKIAKQDKIQTISESPSEFENEDAQKMRPLSDSKDNNIESSRVKLTKLEQRLSTDIVENEGETKLEPVRSRGKTIKSQKLELRDKYTLDNTEQSSDSDRFGGVGAEPEKRRIVYDESKNNIAESTKSTRVIKSLFQRVQKPILKEGTVNAVTTDDPCATAIKNLVGQVLDGQYKGGKVYLQPFRYTKDDVDVQRSQNSLLKYARPTQPTNRYLKPFDCLQEEEPEDCDAIQIQFIVDKESDNRFNDCFTQSGQGKFCYARIRYVQDTRAVQLFDPSYGRYVSCKCVDFNTLRGLVIRLIDGIDLVHAKDDDMTPEESWSEICQTVYDLIRQREKNPRIPFAFVQ